MKKSENPSSGDLSTEFDTKQHNFSILLLVRQQSTF